MNKVATSGLRKFAVVLLLAFGGALPAQMLARPLSSPPQSASDDSLAAVRRSDRAIRGSDGKLNRLPATEHRRRENIYMSNRVFAEAREHWEALLKFYPQDENIPAALFGIGRSYFQERKYQEAFTVYDNLRKK